MSRTGWQFFISLVVLAAAGGLWWWLGGRPAAGPAPLSFEEQVAAAKEANGAGLSPEAAAVASQAASAPFTRTYENTSYGFSFGYPDSLKVGSSEGGDGSLTIIAQDAAAHVGFQVRISPWEGGDITTEQIKQDLPQIEVRVSQQVTVGGAPALAFLTSDSNFGDSRQVWFSYRGLLYQVSTYSSQDALLEKVLGTWQFNN